MRIHRLLGAGLLAVAAGSAQAENIDLSVPLLANAAMPGAFAAPIGVTHLLSGAFVDTFTLTGASGGMVSAALLTMGFMDTGDIDFSAVSLNGDAFNLLNMEPLEIATFNAQSLTGPLVIRVEGTAGPTMPAGQAIAASYGGIANVAPAAPVPEASTLALMAAGLFGIGMFRRRKGA